MTNKTILIERVFFAATATNGATKTDGRKNNGKNLTTEARSKGGKIAHQRGTAHEFTSDEARKAGRIGGKKSQKRGINEEDDNEE